MLISSALPSLIGGVSQQPAALRLTSACTAMENAWPSVVSGNQKRPASQHVKSIPLTLSNGVAGYLIERGSDYRYSTIITNGDLKVIDLNTGNLQTVTYPDGKTYLNATSPIDSFRFVTIGDYTFITNKTVTVTKSAVAEPVGGETRLNPAAMATIYVTAAVANSYYSIYINNILVAEYLTPDGTQASTAVPDTAAIATQLRNDLVAAVGSPGKLGSTQYTVTQTGSTLTITNFPANGTLTVQANTGDKSLRAFVNAVQTFNDLPPQSPEGRIVKVEGSPESQDDSYYVVFRKGTWIETVSYGEGEALNNSTMPHVLVRNVDGTWTFRRHTWNNRIVGDANANQTPSFVGFTVNDIFVYQNRMGFLADENVILSQTDVYENFYRTSNVQVLDSDRIDVAVLYNNTNILSHAVQYNRDLLLCSDIAQFRLTYQNYLGPKTIQIKFTTAFDQSKRIKPINMGNSIYFIDDRADYRFMKVWEYFPKDLAISDDADDVTAPIPEYIPYDAQFFAGSNRVKVSVLNSAQSPNELFVYKFYWAGERKVQSSWHKWTFNDCVKIHWGDFSGTYFYMLIQRSDGLYLERIRFDEDVFDNNTNYEILLDRRSTPSAMSYNSTTDKTTITLPWSTTANVEVVSSDPPAALDATNGYRHEVTKVSGNTVTVDGDITLHTVAVGLGYTWLYEFSTFLYKAPAGEGTAVVLDGRLQIRYLTLEHHNTAFYQAHVKLPGRAEVVSTFNGRLVGSADSVLGTQAFASGTYRVPIMSRNLDARVWLTNDSPFPHAFGSAEWQGFMTLSSAKRV